MDAREVTAKVPEKKDAEGVVVQGALGPVTVLVPFPKNYEEAADYCTEEAMLSNAFANFKVTPVQAMIRAGLKAGKSEEQIQEEAEKLVMGIARQGGGKVDVKAAYAAKFRSATPEEQAQMIADLKRDAGLVD